MRIEGTKVYLRETVEADWKFFADWESKESVTEFFTINKGKTYEDVADEIRGREDDPTQMDLTVCLREDDSVIGRIILGAINTHYDSMDISRIYIGDTSMRGLGLGEDALRCAMKYGFDVLGCERVTLDYMTANKRAHSLYLKCGFTDEGCMRHGGKKDGRYLDLNLMSILREEYYR